MLLFYKEDGSLDIVVLGVERAWWFTALVG